MTIFFFTTMSIKIVQWNLNGFINNYNELILFVHDMNPDVIYVQETHFANQSKNIITPKQYLGYFKNLNSNSTSKQGIGFLIKRHIPPRIDSNQLPNFMRRNSLKTKHKNHNNQFIHTP